MNTNETALILIILFYFVPGLAIYLKLFRYGAAPLWGKFLVVLPIQGYYVSVRVLWELYVHLTKEKIISSRSLIANYYMVTKTWTTCLPVFFAHLGVVMIDNSNAIKHKIRRTSNDCRDNLITDLKEKYA